MPADRDQARAKVDGMFRPGRRTDVGTGGMGNPHETWSDLKSLLHTSFLLDTDSVFTVSAWTSSRLIAACDEVISSCQRMSNDIQGLLTEPRSIEDLTDLDKASALLNQALIGTQTSSNPAAAAGKRQAAVDQISKFVSGSLVPAIDPSLSGADLRSPAESRRDLRSGLLGLLARMTEIDSGVKSLQDLTKTVPAQVPTKMAAGIIRDTRSKMNRIRLRMSSTPPALRAASARDDMYELAAGITTMGLLDRDPNPVLERGGPYSCTASGSGMGATVLGGVSAPFAIIDGRNDTLQLAIDGGAPVTVDLLVAKVLPFYGDLPRPASWVFPWPIQYTVPAGPGESLFLFANGIRGPVLNLAPGTYTAPILIALLTGVVPPDPSPPNNPYLLVTANLVGGGYAAIRLTYNNLAPVAPLVDLGAHFGIGGTTRFLNVELGIPLDQLVADPTTAGFSIYRLFWRPAQQGEVLKAIKDGFPGIRAEPSNSVVLNGRSTYDSAFPDRLIVSRYFGNGIWNPDASLLTLETDFRKVKIGDEVVAGTTAGTVTSIEADGVKVSFVATLAAGTYTVGIRPPPPPLVGLTLRVVDQWVFGVDHRIIAATPTADGRIELQVSWNMYWMLYGATRDVDYEVISDLLLLGSSDTGTGASFEVQAVANNASVALGFPVAPVVTGDVDQINDPAADFVTAGVLVGDIVSLAGLPDNEVDEILGPTDIRLVDQIPATFTGQVQIYNRKYWRHNAMLPGLAAWTSAPSKDDLSSLVAESTRTSGAASAAGSLASMLSSLSATASSVRSGLVTYRSGVGQLSPYMVDARNALEESGADRAVEMLQTGNMPALFNLKTDEASSSRLVLKNIRKVSRKLLGTSVYALATERELEGLQEPEQFFLDSSSIPTEEIGPPRSTRP